jgi:hypothetical protein
MFIISKSIDENKNLSPAALPFGRTAPFRYSTGLQGQHNTAGTARLSRQQFQDRYGTNDTTRALIGYYFEKNKRAKRDLIIYGFAGVAAGFLLDAIIMGRWNMDALGGLILGLILGSFVYVCGITVLISLYKWWRLSRRRLMVQLERYRAGKPLRKSIYRNTAFKKQLDLEKHISANERP